MSISREPPPLESNAQVDVKVASRRFWTLSPDKVEFKHAHMHDAIDRLRTLKAS